MVGLCEDGNEPSGSLKAIWKLVGGIRQRIKWKKEIDKLCEVNSEMMKTVELNGLDHKVFRQSVLTVSQTHVTVQLRWLKGKRIHTFALEQNTFASYPARKSRSWIGSQVRVVIARTHAKQN
ncbi:hypothetical protein ANN_19034 [Periplaneta americana]|uniref:Uncharacterized protein n=1 Tax=Periplaneta americana TaxID=6978 RepID=A0ABQ8SRX7_PERAM|nr:hypothetical protein ANN_19034 [Periplaneta americana]